MMSLTPILGIAGAMIFMVSDDVFINIAMMSLFPSLVLIDLLKGVKMLRRTSCIKWGALFLCDPKHQPF